ncbi:MAG: hypothetical protein ACUVRL_04565 [Candidatus Saccharicenans sp.]|uniref:hypothetical protein n=1 Tax=Candidatus Saccharicenans sp. TaxID=2819258 RepID=UPI00404ACE81
MTEKKGLPVLIILSCLLLFLSARADWKSEINELLKQREYEPALNLLESTLPGLEQADLQDARGLLPFLYFKNNLPEEEKKALIEYFEEYGDSQPLLSFLDFSIFNQALEYWGRWREEFPLISNINFLLPATAEDRSIPEVLRIGFDLSAESYYKIQLEGNPLEGGLWNRGPHLIQLPLPFYFDQSYSLSLDVFLKTRSITVKKRIVLEFRIEKKSLSNQELLVQRQDSPPVKNVEGELAFYIGDTLIFKATKYLQKQIPVRVTIPPPNPPGTKPYMVPEKDQPYLRGISILDAVSAIAGALKDWKKKPPARLPPSFVKKPEINFTFTSLEKQDIRTEVSIKLQPVKAETLKY